MSTVPPIAAWPAAPLSGKVVLVTGCANGIGRGIAQAVLGAGGRVLIGDLDVEAGEACLAEWQRGEDAVFQRLDITDEASVRAFIAVALQRFGRIDGLVNNAGIASPHGTLLQDMDWDEWQRRLSSLHGAFLCSKHALPALTASAAGAIINIASTRAWQSEAHSEAYAAAKGGLVAFTHALAISSGPAVRVNSISPGWIGTCEWQAPSRRHAPEYSATDHAQHPVGRVGQPEDIGALAVYLLSSLSGFSTGQDFIVDGGMTRKMIYAE
ncbi:SDR family oxidoreductase [Stenotrophomonas maltophilia]|uniref:SDR family oxidoreductase n=1 Tax=Stenotrophomonas maltophilia TaxID=40324 RepID=UPI0021C7CC38|nr:SDR family oxidoreductase [Stenotrophomonas maltophilia]MCU1196018.1 SDR family oxidoreductase [Stenotrophomonas maltophilia]